MKTLLRQRTFWAALSAILTAIGAVIAAPVEMRLTVAIGSLAACFAALGTIFAREGGVNAALQLSGTIEQTPETEALVREVQAKVIESEEKRLP